ncbi:uncharacterized protein LAESUDRAFT_763530 [Laetiporus sulphureus 93-53]|uniref:Alpha-type protein kinase domain-containing protein n=1 Tax=Laetiporus sulphureus 93-53 TaxID=1314785 RepID=A0A165BUB3_9APHY|nr:uncharacterized protein LAESUDRAFT_763530 [Laetiporus sulphureus 93-53]KZT01664.1 hypothetical protein LAESUDRAFT_763530 [Laetiporus sulphureus 93-53]
MFRVPTAAVDVNYKSYSIRVLSCTVDEHGHPAIVEEAFDEVILIAKGWQKFKDRKVPTDPWVGRGGSKVVCQGMFKHKEYAICQVGPLGAFNLNTEPANKKDLLDELKTTAIGQFFIKDFMNRADAEGYADLPEMRFNFDGAFVGEVTSHDFVGGPYEYNDDNDDPLLLHSFLATPLISLTDGYKEIKFSGSLSVGHNPETFLGNVVNTFAHHVYDVSDKTCILVDLQELGFVSNDEKTIVLFDPQAHTNNWASGKTGYWDLGEKQIAVFAKEHTCKNICHALKLPKLLRGSGSQVPAGRAANAVRRKQKAPFRIQDFDSDCEIEELSGNCSPRIKISDLCD